MTAWINKRTLPDRIAMRLMGKYFIFNGENCNIGGKALKLEWPRIVSKMSKKYDDIVLDTYP